MRLCTMPGSGRRARRETRQAPNPSSSIHPGDVVIAKVGKHHYWPAVVSESTVGVLTEGMRLVFFGDHKELVVSSAAARSPTVRPFSDLDQLSARERPRPSNLYLAALEEAQRWEASSAGRSSCGATCQGESSAMAAASHRSGGAWKIDGAVVPASLMMRAMARRLPRAGCEPTIDSPPATFRVLERPSAAPRPPITTTLAADEPPSDDDDDGGDDDDDDDAYLRRHAPFEQLEMQGFAAHPMVHTILQGSASGETSEAGASIPTADTSGHAAPPARPVQRSRRCESLVGRRLRVPSDVFGVPAPGEGGRAARKRGAAMAMRSAECYYEGVVMGVSQCQGRDALEVHFADDHSTCQLSPWQVKQWLIPGSASTVPAGILDGSCAVHAACSSAEGAPPPSSYATSRKRKTAAAGGEQLRVRLRLAGVTAATTAETDAMPRWCASNDDGASGADLLGGGDYVVRLRLTGVADSGHTRGCGYATDGTLCDLVDDLDPPADALHAIITSSDGADADGALHAIPSSSDGGSHTFDANAAAEPTAAAPQTSKQSSESSTADSSPVSVHGDYAMTTAQGPPNSSELPMLLQGLEEIMSQLPLRLSPPRPC